MLGKGYPFCLENVHFEHEVLYTRTPRGREDRGRWEALTMLLQRLPSGRSSRAGAPRS